MLWLTWIILILTSQRWSRRWRQTWGVFGSLYRVFSELDSHALRTVQEESLSVAGSRLIEAEKALAASAPPAAPCADGPPAPSAADVLPAATVPGPAETKEEAKDKALGPDKGIKPTAPATPGAGSWSSCGLSDNTGVVLARTLQSQNGLTIRVGRSDLALLTHSKKRSCCQL